MSPILIAIIIVLCQYPVAMLTLMKMFRCRQEKTATVIWNFIIVFLPFVGALSFWIYYVTARKKIKQNIENKANIKPFLLEGKTVDEPATEEADGESDTASALAEDNEEEEEKAD